LCLLLEFQCLYCGHDGLVRAKSEKTAAIIIAQGQTVYVNAYQNVEFGSSWNHVLLSVLSAECVYIITENIIGFKLEASEFMNHEIV